MSTRFYRFLLKYVIPEITILVAPGPNWNMKKKLLDSMLPGDFLVSKSSFHLTNWLIGGDFSHAAIVLDKDVIAEMKANDFDIATVKEFCKGATRVALLRINNIPEGYGLQMAAKSMDFSESKYDVEFKMGPEALFCSELCWASDFKGLMQADLTDLIGVGTKYISPDGVYKAKNVEVVFEWQDTFF